MQPQKPRPTTTPRMSSEFRRVPTTPAPAPVAPGAAKRPMSTPTATVPMAAPTESEAIATVSPLPPESPSPSAPPAKKSGKGWKIFAALVALLCVILAGMAAYGYYWYSNALQAVEAGDGAQVRLVIENGATATQVADQLSDERAIRDARAFGLYYRFHHTTGFKSGVYLLNKNMTVQQIVAHLEEGKPDEFNLTFLPGATLADAKKTLEQAGYESKDIDQAFNAQYDHPLLKGRPEGASIEGYLYGDTYSFYSGATLEDILTKIFDHMYADVQENKLEEAYAKQGMTLYQGLTFASIVQSEVSTVDDMPLVSQVFHKRLAEDMPLGSDVTFIYGARLLGVAPAVELDSPYNTRVRKGLTPTPVSNPGLAALKAGANPSATEYLYFVAGDDGKTYFSRTNEEHEAATKAHCAQNCVLPEQ